MELNIARETLQVDTLGWKTRLGANLYNQLRRDEIWEVRCSTRETRDERWEMASNDPQLASLRTRLNLFAAFLSQKKDIFWFMHIYNMHICHIQWNITSHCHIFSPVLLSHLWASLYINAERSHIEVKSCRENTTCIVWDHPIKKCRVTWRHERHSQKIECIECRRQKVCVSHSYSDWQKAKRQSHHIAPFDPFHSFPFNRLPTHSSCLSSVSNEIKKYFS